MNTVAKGNEFEAKSLEILKKVIEEEQLGHLANTIRIFEQKEYFSRDRGASIKFDLTIEVWPPGASRYVMIYIIECKHYSSRVPVEKIERFRDQIRQVTGLNAKAIFITNSPLQESAFKIAENSGMMLIQGQSSQDYRIILHKSNRDKEELKLPVFEDTLDSTQIDIGINLIEKLIDKKLLGVLINIEATDFVSYGIDKLSKNDIQKLAIEKLDEINPAIINSGTKLLSLLQFKQFIEAEGIKIIEVNDSDDVLANCNLNESTISISRSIVGTNREFFILAHEYGHYVLHQKLTIGQISYESFSDSEYNFRTGKNDLKNARHWIEWQANYFASCLIMTEINFRARLRWCKKQIGGSGDKISLNDHPQSIREFQEILKRMAYVYDVSKASIQYKLEEFKLIDNQSRLKSIKDIINENGLELFI